MQCEQLSKIVRIIKFLAVKGTRLRRGNKRAQNSNPRVRSFQCYLSKRNGLLCKAKNCPEKRWYLKLRLNCTSEEEKSDFLAWVICMNWCILKSDASVSLIMNGLRAKFMDGNIYVPYVHRHDFSYHKCEIFQTHAVALLWCVIR